MLNPDYYSADLYVENQEESSVSLIKSFVTLLVLGVFILVYTYYVKNNISAISSWLSEVKEIVLFKNEKVINEKVINIKKDSKITEIVEQINKIIQPVESTQVNQNQPETVKKNKPKQGEDKVLTAEYLKLMKESLGNY